MHGSVDRQTPCSYDKAQVASIPHLSFSLALPSLRLTEPAAPAAAQEPPGDSVQFQGCHNSSTQPTENYCATRSRLMCVLASAKQKTITSPVRVDDVGLFDAVCLQLCCRPFQNCQFGVAGSSGTTHAKLQNLEASSALVIYLRKLANQRCSSVLDPSRSSCSAYIRATSIDYFHRTLLDLWRACS